MQYSSLNSASPVCYSIKLIDPAKKAEYVIKKLHGLSTIFNSVDEVKKAIKETCESIVSLSLESVGYVEPGHGPRGKQRWLISDADVAEMYELHCGKKEILLWCYNKSPSHGHARKRACSPTSDDSTKPAKSSRYTTHLEKMTEVEAIEEKLKNKHSNEGARVFSDEQFRSWAHLIQMGKHSSYDTPPDKPFWKNRTASSANSHTPTGQTSATISPGKRINLRGQCVEQLLRLHELLEKGGISMMRV